MQKEYKTVTEISGPLILVEGVEQAGYEELVEVRTPSGETRRGKVLEVHQDWALVQMFEGTTGLDQNAAVRFLGRGVELPVSADMLGRVYNGSGRARDGGPEIIAEKKLDINGL
ncbi:MAG: V-type ATP synthase subunit B, partial [Candidatus Margulisbacteria bacterium]|nr:V-type ATP synthase subunit B [Candidatus Margulisiibacteriota bacterium]